MPASPLPPSPPPRLSSLPRLFKGAGPGTYWCAQHQQNSGLPQGLSSPRALQAISVHDVVVHITAYSANSPLTSVTASYAVALAYSRVGITGAVSPTNPGFIFEIDLGQAPPNQPVRWFDPVSFVPSQGIVHHHQGDQRLLAGLANRRRSFPPVPQPGGGTQVPVFTREFQAVVYAARDAELLLDLIPAACIVRTHRITI